MPRYRLVLEYDGSGFCGWQSQSMVTGERGDSDFPVRTSVQQALSRAVACFSGEQIVPIGAGRTDSGVHALGQVAHLDLNQRIEGKRLREALNAHLRAEAVVVVEAAEVAADFHARFDARARHYLYRICNRRAPPVLDRGRVWHVRRPLDEKVMNMASLRLVGRHDFTTFRSVRCQAASPVKTLDRLMVHREGGELVVHGCAKSFLYHQMRSMVGALKLVGEGKWSVDDLTAVLAAQDRSACPMLAPAAGLYLAGVEYADESGPVCRSTTQFRSGF